MIAILRADREGEPEVVAFDEALRLPNLESADDAPGLLAALLGAREQLRDGDTVRDASLALTRALWRSGVLGGPWLSLPYTDATAPDPFGDVDAWLDVTCAAMAREAAAAVQGLGRSRERVASDEAKILRLGRAAYSAVDLLHLLTSRLIVSIGEAADALGQTVPTAGAAMARLEQLGVAREVTGRAKGRRFAYRALVNGMAP
ncbi:MAG: hypothetical protein HY084_13570 [Gemmatimonadetes bacterium]|nr:hypothetical protein [Gemmatimonadota bacterium]